MKTVLFHIFCLASTYGRVAVDKPNENVNSLIVDSKSVKTEPVTVNNTSKRTNVSDVFNERSLTNVTINEVLGEIKINNNITSDATDISDNLIEVKSISNETVIQVLYEAKKTVSTTDERTNVTDNLNKVKLSIETKTENELLCKDLCKTRKEQLDNLISAHLDISKSESKKAIDNGTALLLTKYIKEGRYKEARAASKVDSSVFLGIKSYSGFITVNETYNSNIFFWYFPVLNKSVTESPWIIWLQGGPGASSLLGLFDEIGPFTVSNNTLKRNPYTWLQNHSLVFIDNPVGTGYSFTDHADGYVTDMAGYASQLYSTLKQFLAIFPELKSAPLYIAGESYAGKYVPAMAMEIHKGNQNLTYPVVNLQGMIMGNAYVDPGMIRNMTLPFYYFGLLVKEQIEVLQPLVDSFHQHIQANRSVEAMNNWNKLHQVIRILTRQQNVYNLLNDDRTVGKFIDFLNTSEVKRAIHVGDIDFSVSNKTVYTKLAPDFLSTTKPLFEKLLDHYRVLAICGQLDQILPCVLASENYRTWKWNSSSEFIYATRFPFVYEGSVAGYHQTGGHFTEVVIRGAGHMVTVDAPAPTQNLITRWTHQKPLTWLQKKSYVLDNIKTNSLAYYL